MQQTGRRSGSWSRKGMLAVATTIAAALALSGCASSDNGGASSSGTSAAQSSAAQASSAAPGSSAKPSSAASSQATSGTTASLTIATNGISGGKNALEADWITNYVIPEFTKAAGRQGRHRHRDLPALRRRRRAVQVQARPRPEGRQRPGHHVHRRHLGRRVRPGRLHQAALRGGRPELRAAGTAGRRSRNPCRATSRSRTSGTASRPAPTAGSSSSTRSCSSRRACPPTGSPRAGTTSPPPPNSSRPSTASPRCS